jgi:hypothetical protein
MAAITCAWFGGLRSYRRQRVRCIALKCERIIEEEKAMAEELLSLTEQHLLRQSRLEPQRVLVPELVR